MPNNKADFLYAILGAFIVIGLTLLWLGIVLVVKLTWRLA